MADTRNLQIDRHGRLIEIGQALNLDFDKKGVCFGASYLAIDAILTDQAVAFNNFMHQITDYTAAEFRKLKFVKHHSSRRLYSKTQKVLSLLAKYQHKQKLGWQAANDTERPDHCTNIALRFSGSYSRMDLILYLLTMKSCANQFSFQHAIALQLNDIDHAIMIAYLPADDSWFLFDINQFYLAKTNKLAEVAKFIADSFETSNRFIFATDVHVNQQDVWLFEPFIAAWQACNVFQQIHQINSYRANANDNKNASWLALALNIYETKILQPLLALTNDWNYKAAYRTALLEAVVHQDEQLVDQLLAANVSCVQLNQVNSPLVRAVKKGQLAILQKLMLYCYDINASIAGRTLIHYAVTKNQPNILAYLLSMGADTKINYNKQSPFFIACANNFSACAKLLLAHGDDMNEACKHKNYFDYTPLLIAFRNQAVETIFSIVENMPSVNIELPRINKTPLLWAIENNAVELVDKLINLGADIELRGSSDYSPLMEACFQGNLAIVTTLLLAGAKLQGNHMGLTALHFAVQSNHFEVVRLLLQHGAEITNVVMATARNSGDHAILKLLNNHLLSTEVALSSFSFFNPLCHENRTLGDAQEVKTSSTFGTI